MNQTMMGLKPLRDVEALPPQLGVNQTMMGLKPEDSVVLAAQVPEGESDHDGIET